MHNMHLLILLRILMILLPILILPQPKPGMHNPCFAPCRCKLRILLESPSVKTREKINPVFKGRHGYKGALDRHNQPKMAGQLSSWVQPVSW